MWTDTLIKLVIYGTVLIILQVVFKKKKVDTNPESMENQEIHIELKGYAKGFLVCAIIFTICIILLAILPGNIQGKTKWTIAIIAIGCNILLYLSAWMCWLWKMTFYEDKVVYRNGIGKIKEVQYKDVSHAMLTKKNKLRLYSGDQTLLTISGDLVVQFVVEDLKDCNVPIRSENIG